MGSRIRDKPLLVTIEANDLILVSEEIGETYSTKRCPVSVFFDQIPVPVSITANVALTGDLLDITSDVVIEGSFTMTGNSVVGEFSTTEDHIVITEQRTPANSSANIAGDGSICWDNDYLYVQTALGVKRIALSEF